MTGRFALALLALLCAAPLAADPVTGATDALNGFRAKVNLPPLRRSGVLQQIAERHALDLNRHAGFSHTGSDGSRVGDRARRAGYGFCLIAENIAKGQPGLDDVMRDWGVSDGHRRNLLLAEATEYGFARGAGDLWVLVLARPGC